MALPELLGGAIDAFRTDPAGFACLAVGVALPLYAERLNVSEDTKYAALVAGLGILTTGVIHFDNMFRYAERIETSLQRNGFDEKTRFRIRAYCPRQVGYVVSERTGYAKQYEKLCTGTKPMRWSFLPNITEHGLHWPGFTRG